MLTTTIKAHTCPACETDQSALSGDGAPDPGDYVLCTACGCWLVVVDTDLALRLLRDGEWIALPVNERLRLTDIRERIKVEGKRRKPWGTGIADGARNRRR